MAIVVEAEIERLSKFGEFLRADDKAVADDLLNQCRNYTPYAGTMASPLKEVPLIISMLFAQHKKIGELEKALAQKQKLGLNRQAGPELILA